MSYESEIKTRIGIDLGGSHIKAGEVDTAGNIIRRHTEPTESRCDYNTIIQQVTRIIKELQRQSVNHIELVGFGTAGLMSQDNQKVLFAPNLDGLNNKFIVQDLSDLCGLDVLMDNDANCMALGEGLAGAARGMTHYIAITLGTGVGGAIISNGTLIRGWKGGGGEIGHVPINLTGPQCDCGSQGCLEAFIGINGIKNHITNNYPSMGSTSIKQVHSLASNGNEEARAVFAWIGQTLAFGLAGLVNIFNPKMIVIGGGIATARDFLFVPLKSKLAELALAIYYADMIVCEAELGTWAGVVGAANLDNLDPVAHRR